MTERGDSLPGEGGHDAAALGHEVLGAQLAVFAASLQAVRDGADPEALHDLRVALRRSRTALAELTEAFPKAAGQDLGRDLAWLARLTGPLRDLDVYLGQLPAYARALPRQLRGSLLPLREFALTRHDCVRQELLDAIDSPRFSLLLERWRSVASAAYPAVADPIDSRTLAARRVARRYRRLVERGAGIDTQSPPEALHALRKSGKKLRYLLELFGGELPRAERDGVLKRLRRLQDALGRHHDLCVHGELTARFAEQLSAAGRGTTRTLIAAGALVQALYAEERASVQVCIEAMRGVKRPKTRRRLARLCTAPKRTL